MHRSPSRRALLRTGLAAGVGLAASRAVRAAEVRPATAPGAFRIAHLTDMHVEPGPRSSAEGFAAPCGRRKGSTPSRS